jgi:hypothetical protein
VLTTPDAMIAQRPSRAQEPVQAEDLKLPRATNLLQLTRHNKTLSTVYINAAHIVRFERAADDITTAVWLDDKHGSVLDVDETPAQIAWAMTGVQG